MRMVKIGARRVIHREFVDIASAGRNGEARMAVGALGDDHAVPVDDARLIQSVLEMNAHPFPAPKLERGTEVAAGGTQGTPPPFDHFPDIPENRRGLAFPDGNSIRFRADPQYHVWILGGAAKRQSEPR